jgi:hypothetical protein
VVKTDGCALPLPSREILRRVREKGINRLQGRRFRRQEQFAGRVPFAAACQSSTGVAAPKRQKREKIATVQRRKPSTMPKQAVVMTPFGRIRE